MKQFLIRSLQKIAGKLLTPTIYNIASNRQNQILLQLKYRETTAQKIKLDFEDVGFNTYSMTHEDGILLYIFSVIGMTNRKCVDIGAGSIRGSSVANLIINHEFKGLLVDGDTKSIEHARTFYNTLEDTHLSSPTLISTLVNAENINNIIQGKNFSGEIDLFCLDIDGMDYWVWKALDVIQPRVVLLEYQDLLGPDRAWTVPYDQKFNADDYPVNKENKNYCGASLQAFIKLGREKGYRLVGCNNGGWNAFFIKNGIGEDILPEVSAQSCFKFAWNQYGVEHRFPLVKDMEWVEV
jgi:hypothetical protein